MEHKELLESLQHRVKKLKSQNDEYTAREIQFQKDLEKAISDAKDIEM